MTEKDFKKLQIELEKKMVELDILQSRYQKETGKRYTMPCYLETPKHIEKVREKYNG